DEVVAKPEHRTALDKFSGPRHHDLLAVGLLGGTPQYVVGVEAKACESFDRLVKDRSAAAPPSRKRMRCNLMARALFGHDVLDEATGEVLDEELGEHGYQLWTAAVGTIIEAGKEGVEGAVLVVHQFRPADLDALPPGDTRNWEEA